MCCAIDSKDVHSTRSLDHLGDFTTTARVVPITVLAVTIAVVAYPDERLRILVFRMAETGVTELPVIGRLDGKIIGVVALADLLKGRARILEAERRREHVLGPGLRLPTRKSGMF
jgi:CBS-domain-containing membrane protein